METHLTNRDYNFFADKIDALKKLELNIEFQHLTTDYINIDTDINLSRPWHLVDDASVYINRNFLNHIKSYSFANMVFSLNNNDILFMWNIYIMRANESDYLKAINKIKELVPLYVAEKIDIQIENGIIGLKNHLIKELEKKMVVQNQYKDWITNLQKMLES